MGKNLFFLLVAASSPTLVAQVVIIVLNFSCIFLFSFILSSLIFAHYDAICYYECLKLKTVLHAACSALFFFLSGLRNFLILVSNDGNIFLLLFTCFGYYDALLVKKLPLHKNCDFRKIKPQQTWKLKVRKVRTSRKLKMEIGKFKQQHYT